MIGKKIMELRKKNGFSRKDLAQKIGVSISTVKYWENGSTEPRIENIKALASTFCVTTDYLLEQSEIHALYHNDLDENDIVVLNAIIQHIVNLKNHR